jgi:hypothetical protein
MTIPLTINIDRKMQAISASMPPKRWDIQNLSNESGLEEGRVRDLLLTQMHFFQISMNLHTPLILKPSPNPTMEHSRESCIESTRELLRRYEVLQVGLHVRPLFECKTKDYVGFEAAVNLLLGIVLRSDAASQDREEWRLIHDAKAIFHKLATNKNCRMALQCYDVLDILLTATERSKEDLHMAASPVKVLIPYFGTVSILRAIKSPAATTVDNSQEVMQVHEARNGLHEGSIDLVWLHFSQGHNLPDISVPENTQPIYEQMEGIFEDIVDWNEVTGWSMSEIDEDWNLVLPGMDPN